MFSQWLNANLRAERVPRARQHRDRICRNIRGFHADHAMIFIVAEILHPPRFVNLGIPDDVRPAAGLGDANAALQPLIAYDAIGLCL